MLFWRYTFSEYQRWIFAEMTLKNN